MPSDTRGIRHIVLITAFLIATGMLCTIPSHSAPSASKEWTALDARRIAALHALDHRFTLAKEDPACPTPNRTLRPGHHEQHYQDKAAAIFGLVDAGEEPRERLAEANMLLRFEMLGKWALDSAGQIQGDSGRWMHRSRSLGMRLYLLYADDMEADIRAEYEKRLHWMVRAPFNNKSENIKLTNNSSYFLAHEILGKTKASTFDQVKTWLTRYLRHHGQQGTHEWGSPYNAWTFLAVFNLAEFAQDAEVKALATMVVDYDLARMLTMSVKGHFCSPAVRRYYFWTVNGFVEPQTQLALLLCSDAAPSRECFADWALSNYAPLTLHRAYLAQATPCEARFSDDTQSGQNKKWLSRIYRGQDFAIATHQSVPTNHYALRSGGSHDIIGCYVQSGKAPENHVVPYGYNPGSVPKKKRDLVERYFGYQNMAFVHHGGSTRAVWAGGRFDGVPIRLFYQKDFSCDIEGKWAFLSDGTTHVAWAPTVGKPEKDTSLSKVSDPKKQGAWLRSTYTPDASGEIAVIEAGDRAMFGGFADFKRDILSRNPAPVLKEGVVTYTAQDGAQVALGPDFAEVNGQRFDPISYPLAEAPGINGNTLTAGAQPLLFDYDTGKVSGDTTRVPTHLHFGHE